MAPPSILITGVYGVGKSTVLAEIGTIMEERALRFAVIDLDWLRWFYTGSEDESADFDLLIRNLGDVITNLRSAGITRFATALSVDSRGQRDAIALAIGGRLCVVRLEATLAEITERIGGDVATGRADDLRWAGIWLRDGIGVGIEDVVIPNRGGVRKTAIAVLETATWI